MPGVSGTWTRLALGARLQRSSQSISVIDNRAYIFGGELVPRQPVDNQIDLIEVESGRAAIKTIPAPTSSPSPRVGTSSAVIGDAFYLFSGRGGLEMAPLEEKGAIWRYHTSQGLWDLIEPRDPFASFPVGRSYHCVASDDKDTIFVHAGCPETGRLADLWAFNVRSRTWTELPEAPSPARGGASITVCDGKLYRMNGFDGKAEQGGSLDIFDLGEAVWSSVSYEPNGVQGPEPRSVSALVAVKVQEQWHLLTMFGERDPSALGHAGAGKMLGDVWAFDVGHRKWAKIEPEGDGPAPRGWFGADVTKDKYAVIVHGGLAEDNSRLGDVWKLQFF